MTTPHASTGASGDADRGCHDTDPQAGSGGAPFGLLLLCFFASGFAALVYQTAWTRQFAFVFGTSGLAVTSVLAAYMGGLALGAAAIARIAPRITRPVLVYGLLELGIGLSALGVPTAVRGAMWLYVTIFGSQHAPGDEGGLATALFYLVCSFAILLVPTSLMGATLPLLARHAVRREEEIGSRIGSLYATNTAGAVAGTVATGFVLLPALGLANTVWVAVAANAFVFALAVMVARTEGGLGLAKAARGDRGRNPHVWILPLIAVSGAASFTYEVLWTRLLGFVLGGSVYAFATMLATFLTGIALGSWFASRRLAADRGSAVAGFAWAQVGAGLLSLAAYLAIDSAPAWQRAMHAQGDLRLLADSAIAAAILLPGTICIGATFPLAVRILARHRNDAAPASARVYAWNTAGAIGGAIAAGFFLIPSLGFSGTLMVGVSANAALAALTALRANPRARAALAASAILLAVLATLRPGPPWTLLGSASPTAEGTPADVVYHGVGRNATVMLQRARDGWKLFSNGLRESFIQPHGVPVGRFVVAAWLGGLPSWGEPDARSMLMVGLGGGLMVEGAPASIEKIRIVEIEAEMIRANEAVAKGRRTDPLSDPRVQITINDARSALLLTRERYDAIVSQPSHPWTAAAAHLYTREFFQLARDHLAENGVFVQWMGLRFVDEPLLATLIATLADVFPHIRLYQPSPPGVLLVGSNRPFDPEHAAEPSLLANAGEFAQLGIHRGIDIAAHLLLDDEGARAFARDAPINTDDRNLLQMRSPEIIRSSDRTAISASLLTRLSEFDPYQRAGLELGWDRTYLVTRIFASGSVKRATEIAAGAEEPVLRSVLLGVVAERRGRSRAAMAHFEHALKLDPTSTQARMRLLVLHRATRGGRASAAFQRLAAGASATVATILAGWELEANARWIELAARDADLARIPPTHPAFPAAARLRAAWRVGRGGTDLAREAVEVLDRMLPAVGSVDDLVLRAHAAAAAGYYRGARVTLMEVLQKLRPIPSHAAIVRHALRVVRNLPSEVLGPERRRVFAAKLRAKLE